MPILNETERQKDKALRKRKIGTYHFVTTLLPVVLECIFDPNRRDILFPSLISMIFILFSLRILPLSKQYITDILILCLSTIQVPYTHTKQNDLVVAFSGFPIMIPASVLLLTQSLKIFIASATVYAMLPFMLTNMIKENYYRLGNAQELQSVQLNQSIHSVITCLMLSYLFYTSKKNEESSWNAQTQAQDSANKLQSFLQSFSHELRNPLNSLKGNLALAIQELERDQKEQSSIQNYLETATTCTEILLQLINNILDSGKSDQDKLEIALQPSKIKTIVNQVWQVFRSTLEMRKLNGLVKIDRDIPSKLMIDPMRITQIMMNLMSNAIKFTKKGRIQLILDWIPNKQEVDDDCFKQEFFEECELSTQDIAFEGEFEKDIISFLKSSSYSVTKYLNFNTQHKRIDDTRVNTNTIVSQANNTNMPSTQGLLKITVLDSGAGMSEQALSKLFQKFSQVSEDSASRNMGTGLGLFITKEIVNLSGGEIRAFSQKGMGTAFIACIPTYYSSSFEMEDIYNQNLLQEMRNKEFRCILVDDSIFNVQLIKNFVCNIKGQVIESFYNGETAFDYLKGINSENEFDVLVIDIDMPGMNGIQLVKKWREIEQRKNWVKCKIIVISGNDQFSENEQQILKNPEYVNKFLKKPISYENFVAALNATEQDRASSYFL